MNHERCNLCSDLAGFYMRFYTRLPQEIAVEMTEKQFQRHREIACCFHLACLPLERLREPVDDDPLNINPLNLGC
jgi:hypothetical protein